MAVRKSLDIIALKPTFCGILYFLSMSYSIFGSPRFTAAQYRQQSPDVLSSSKPLESTREKSRAELERELLLPLFLQERELLKYCSPDHPQLLAVQQRIAGVKDYLANLPATRPEPVPFEATTKSSSSTDGVRITAKPGLIGIAFERLVRYTKLPALEDISLAGGSQPGKAQMNGQEEICPPASVKSIGSSASVPINLRETSRNAKIIDEPLRAIPPQSATKAGFLDSNEVGWSKMVASSKEPAPSLLDQQKSSASIAKTASATEEPIAGGYLLNIVGREFGLFLAAVLLCLLVQSAAFCLILRSYAARLVPARLQQVGARQPRGAPHTGFPRNRTEAGDRLLPFGIGRLKSEKFCFEVSAVASLGSTWADVLQNIEDEGARRRDEVFRQLFQRDAELRKQVVETVTAC
jgi:hypothetical protein